MTSNYRVKFRDTQTNDDFEVVPVSFLSLAALRSSKPITNFHQYDTSNLL